MDGRFEAPEWVRQLPATARRVNGAVGVLAAAAVGAGVWWEWEWVAWAGVVALAVAVAVVLGYRARHGRSGRWFYGTLAVGLAAAAIYMVPIADWRAAVLVVVVGLGALAAVVVSAETRRWLWALALGAVTAAAGLIGAAVLFDVPLAPWGFAVAALLALAVAARAFSRTTLRWVALIVALAAAGGLAWLDLREELVPEVELTDDGTAAGLPDDLSDLDGERLVIVDEGRTEASLVTLRSITSKSVQFGDPPKVEQSSLADVVFGADRAAVVCQEGKQVVLAVDRNLRQGALLRCAEQPERVTLTNEKADGSSEVLEGEVTAGNVLYRLRRPHQEPELLASGVVVAGLGEAAEEVKDATKVIVVVPDGDPQVSEPEVVDTSTGQVVVVPHEGAPIVLPKDAPADTGGGSAELADRAVAGAETLVDRGLAEIAGAESTTTLGIVGWVLLALLALIGYRRLEIVNGRRLAGPVTVKAVEGAASKEKAQALMAYTIAKDIRNPAVVPGALSATDLGSVATTLAGDDKGKTVNALLSVIQKVGFPAGGYTVEALYRGPEKKDGEKDGDAKTGDAKAGDAKAGDAKPGDAKSGDGKSGDGKSENGKPEVHRVSVTLSDARTGGVAAVGALRGESEHEAVENAGYFVARVLLDQSKTQPKWAHWKSPDGSALAAYHRAAAPAVASGREAYLEKVAADITSLEQARAASPGNALIRVELAHRYDMKDRKLDALQEHIAVRARHPHQWLARYRLAVSLDFVANQLAKIWFPGSVTTSRREDLLDQLDACGAVGDLLADPGFRADVPGVGSVGALRGHVAKGQPLEPDRRATRFAFLHLAKLELARVRSLLNHRSVLRSSLSQSERSHWQPLRSDRAARLREVGRVEVARHKIEASLALARIDLPLGAGGLAAAIAERAAVHRLKPAVDRRVGRDDSGWVARYNAACFYAALVAIDTRVIEAGASGALFQNQRRAHVRAAIRLLRAAVNDPHSQLPQPPVWIEKDPDLEPLHDVDEFERWKAEVMPETEEET